MVNRSEIESAAISDRGLNERRPENEDSFLAMGESGIFAVADGVGGAEAGEVASQMAVQILEEAFAARVSGTDAEAIMHRALDRANAAIHRMSRDTEKLSRMATTIVALHIENNVATIGHVGDSRLYRIDDTGNLHRETDDHSVVAEEVRAGRMTEEQADSHPGKNIISRALGAEASVNIDLQTRLVKPGSTFLLCSDGVTRHISDAEIADLLSLDVSPAAICNRIKQICYERGAEDNFTAVVIRLPKESAQQSNAHDTEKTADVLAIPPLDETTVATARKPFADDDLLDLTEGGRRTSTAVNEESEVTNTDSLAESSNQTAASISQLESLVATQPLPQPVAAAASETEATVRINHAGSGSRAGAIAAALIVGSLIGIGIYHFILRQSPAAADSQFPASGAASLSAFEDLRREVDRDPRGFLSKNSVPADAEDYYLDGRAYLLTGDLPRARASFVEARRLLPQSDPANAGVLASDIAVLMAVTNDPIAQANLRSELNAVRPMASASPPSASPSR